MPQVAVKDQDGSRASHNDLFVPMLCERLSQILGKRTRDAMRPRNDTRCAVVHGEVVEHPNGRDQDAVVLQATQAIRVKPLLTKTGKGISAMQTAETVRWREQVVRGRLE